MDQKSKIYLIAGPTASGKSSFSIKLAKKVNGEIINADSMQVYKELKILTARPTLKSQKKINEIIDRTKKGGAEIVKFLEKGSAFYAPAASGVEMAESYLKDLKKQLPCAVYLNGEYGVKDIYAGVPVIIGKGGVEKIVQLSLSDEEKSNFERSIKAVKELFTAAEKIDKSLAS